MTPALRIVSFLPSATEMACALGLAEQLVGVTHECDYPQEVKEKPIVVRSVLPVGNMSAQEIDRAVSEQLRNGQSLYRVDEQLLRKLNPDLILTQDLCQVCAPLYRDGGHAMSLIRKYAAFTRQDFFGALASALWALALFDPGVATAQERSRSG